MSQIVPGIKTTPIKVTKTVISLNNGVVGAGTTTTGRIFPRASR